MERRTSPSIAGISTAIRSIVHGLARAFIVMDALDECTDTNKPGSILLEEIANLQVQPNTHFFATSRFIPDITAKFRGVATLEIRATDADVQVYIENKISEMPICVFTQSSAGRRNPGENSKISCWDVKLIHCSNRLDTKLSGIGSFSQNFT